MEGHAAPVHIGYRRYAARLIRRSRQHRLYSSLGRRPLMLHRLALSPRSTTPFDKSRMQRRLAIKVRTPRAKSTAQIAQSAPAKSHKTAYSENHRRPQRSSAATTRKNSLQVAPGRLAWLRGNAFADPTLAYCPDGLKCPWRLPRFLTPWNFNRSLVGAPHLRNAVALIRIAPAYRGRALPHFGRCSASHPGRSARRLHSGKAKGAPSVVLEAKHLRRYIELLLQPAMHKGRKSP
jgi:hypothetical protein